MQINDFKQIVKAFSDPASEVLSDRSKMVFSVNGELFDLTIETRGGDVFVKEAGVTSPASTWVLKRLANLPLLASRLRDSVGETKMFVSPPANLLPSLEIRPEDTITVTDDALNTTLKALDENCPLETTIMYITSDAGEGKTYLINQMAKKQSQRFLDGESNWLLVPIPLGGKHFLRFDDITVGALQNRYRFPFLYYESFLSLVRMGVIIPAFDGFEEMFVENSSGEALSAMGILVAALDSRGSVVIAARKAYFEFENLKTQEKLFDTISTHSVGFGKLELQRWGKEQFKNYCSKRGVANSETIYDRVSERLGPQHSLLTRPVLVRRLVDIATESPSLDAFLEKIHASGTDFFSVFVRGIIEREANEKWIDRSGERDIGSPLLSVDEHCELLAAVALATWESRVDYLKRDHLEFVADYFSETRKKSPYQAQQIRERIRGHALLISSPNASQAVEFDHEEFRLFFLGEGLADLIHPLNDKCKPEILASLRKAPLPKHAQHAFIRAIKRHPTVERAEAAAFLLDICKLDGQVSFTQENCSWLIIGLLSDADANGLDIRDLSFSADALRDRKLINVKFTDCFFAPTSMETTSFNDCTFTRCHFSQIRIYPSTHFKVVSFADCSVDSVRINEADEEFWDPAAINSQLSGFGVSIPGENEPNSSDIAPGHQNDPEIRDLEKLIRYFMRSTHIGERVILMKLGNRGSPFFDTQLPVLLDKKIMEEIENNGGNTQRRFRLGKTLTSINKAISSAR